MDEKEELIAKIQLSHENMGMHDSLMQQYRIIFIACETIMVAFASAILVSIENLKGLWLTPYLSKGIVIIGVLLCSLWIYVCSHRGHLVNLQKKEMENLILGKKQEDELYKWLKNWFKPYESRWEKDIPRFTFNIALPTIFMIVWGFLSHFLGLPLKAIIPLTAIPFAAAIAFTRLQVFGLPKIQKNNKERGATHADMRERRGNGRGEKF